MKNIQKRVCRFLTVLLSLTMLFVSISGVAKSDEEGLYDLTISDLALNMDQGGVKYTIDLADLDINMKLGANSAMERMLLGVGLSLENSPAAEASLSLEENKVLIAISGFDKLLTASPEELQSAINKLFGENMFDNSEATLDDPLLEFNDEAGQKKLVEQFQKLFAEGIDGLTTEGSESVKVMGESVKAQKIACDMNAKQLTDFMQKSFDILENSDVWEAYWDAYMGTMQANGPGGEAFKPDIQIFFDALTDAKLKGTFWIADSDIYKFDIKLSMTLDANAYGSNTRLSLGKTSKAPQGTDGIHTAPANGIQKTAQNLSSSYSLRTTFDIDVQSEVHGDCGSFATQIDMLDQSETGATFAIAATAEDQDSVQQRTFNMSMGTLYSGVKFPALQIDTKYTDSEKSNRLDAEFQFYQSDSPLRAMLTYDGTKESDAGQTVYDGTVDIQFNMFTGMYWYEFIKTNLSFKTHLIETDLPEEGALIDSEGKELVNLLSLTPKDQDALYQALQTALDDTIGKLTPIPKIEDLIGGLFSLYLGDGLAA